ncbi:hypothetical protein PVAND_017684 [Polypedilum vanderplanki]|uniref:Uncharacterized protein n=1 Tax=Polypedilum vanderplanki TaxID=319348 RepID=A0A9J6B935_POLVA|nr:hypothetical protein PVAND_017684 [Polypedilum vanderplanki]
MCLILSKNNLKNAIIAGKPLVNSYIKLCHQYPLILKETFVTMPMMMTTLLNHYMFDVIDDAIYWLVQAGIPQYWYNYHEWYRFFRHYKVKNYKELESIILNDLSFGFTIWLVACGILILVFLIELRIWPKRKK